MNKHPSFAATAALEEIRRILVAGRFIEPEDEHSVHMLEDLVHYAYFTGCINRSDVQRLLNLSKEQVRKRIRSWKMWQDGNRSCRLRQNPFYEDWSA